MDISANKMLQKLYFRYLRNLLIFSILVILLYIGLRFCIGEYLSDNLPFLLIGFIVFTALTHLIIAQADALRLTFRPDDSLSKEDRMKAFASIERKFISRYMLVTGIKLLTFLLVLVLYAFFNKEDIFGFAIGFFVIYLLYSVFEIIQIRRPVVGKITKETE
ncbi:MAG: hypothetical protein LBR36_04955 [Bacteroidales bacterium]|jgi:hypothetical protein|nr:hypothetical protein [Bacteroidales bacterium]